MRQDQNARGTNDVFDRAKALSLTHFMEMEMGQPAGKQRGRYVRFPSCPNPECVASTAENNDSVSVADDRQFRCFRCGLHGSIIDVAMLIWGLASPLEAARTILGESSGPRPQRVEISPEVLIKAKAREAALHQALKALCGIVEVAKDDRCNLQYLCQERRIPEAIVRQAQERQLLGFLPSSKSRAVALLNEQLGADLLEQAGLWDRAKYPTPWIAGRPIIFFFPGLRAAEFRLNRAPRSVEKKSLRCGSTPNPWYWEGRDPARALVVEGGIDLLSGVSLGYKGHVIGSPGCNNWQPEWFLKLREKGVSCVDIAFDNDTEADNNPGQTWAQALADFLRDIGMPHRITAPKKGDLNDLLREKFAAILKAA